MRPIQLPRQRPCDGHRGRHGPHRLTEALASLGLTFGLLLGPTPSLAQTPPAAPSDEEDLASAFGDRSALQGPNVSIATGRSQPLRRAPAVASVITAEDIERMGATDLDEVMETVPGVHVSRNVQGHNPLYLIRGIYGQFNPQTLVLLDGMPLTMLFLGNRGNAWGGLPLENIARIEVIRGPGSALHGADAYSGVINLVSKGVRDIDGTELGARVGSFRSHQAWALHGGQWGPWAVAAYVRHGRTDGDSRVIEADAQTQIDRALGTQASLAPGGTRTRHDDLDAQISLNWGAATLRLGHLARDNIGLGVGAASSLDPVGRGRTARSYANLSVRDLPLANHWRLHAQLTGLHFATTYPTPLLLYPAGAWSGSFPQGMRGAPNTWERQFRGSLTTTYTGWPGHVLSLGVGHEDLDLYRTQEFKNFTLPAGAPPQPLPGAQVVEVALADSFLIPHRRKVDHLIVQDEWSFARDWTLTAGVRRDQYSDVGHTTNPRVALVWDTSLNLTTKLLHGRAFRAPSFVELYSINNPVLRGNPALKPETIRTTELAFDWQARHDTQVQLSLFHYGMRDIIAATGTPQVFQNTGRQSGKGWELEARHDIQAGLVATGHYAWQRSVERATQQDVGYAPHHHAYARLDWQWDNGLAWSGQLNHVGERQRPPGDTRTPTPSYTTMDLTVRVPGSASKWEFSASVRNLFDADVTEPSLYSPGNAIPVLIPGDVPLAGRSFHVQIKRAL
ncbi:MAG: TonB-dependent receptor [Burkholderiales bacterium]|nr:TonB-dependent receptor [Burkholderiales bacterium]MBH2014872.1 TonB-dependent receptor [Burkholderiales bacterium]